MNSPTPDQVREWRESFDGKTVAAQRKLAGESVDQTSSAVQSWELGRRTMPGGLWRLARAQMLDCSPNEIA